jgi:hypothetical protein
MRDWSHKSQANRNRTLQVLQCRHLWRTLDRWGNPLRGFPTDPKCPADKPGGLHDSDTDPDTDPDLPTEHTEHTKGEWEG